MRLPFVLQGTAFPGFLQKEGLDKRIGQLLGHIGKGADFCDLAVQTVR